MGFLMILFAAVTVGIAAQVWKGRAGALWGMFTFFLLGLAYFVIYFLTAMADPSVYQEGQYGFEGLALMIGVGGGLIMVLLVATLPSIKARPPENRAGPDNPDVVL